MDNIKINLTLDEANLVINALGDQPYRKVFKLIGKIQEQAAGQVEQEEPSHSLPENENGVTTH